MLFNDCHDVLTFQCPLLQTFEPISTSLIRIQPVNGSYNYLVNLSVNNVV